MPVNHIKVCAELKTECTGKPTEMEDPPAYNNSFPILKCCHEATVLVQRLEVS